MAGDVPLQLLVDIKTDGVEYDTFSTYFGRSSS